MSHTCTQNHVQPIDLCLLIEFLNDLNIKVTSIIMMCCTEDSGL